LHSLILKPGRDKSLRRRHPWVFSGAVAELRGAPAPGETVEIHAAGGEFLAVAAFSPESQIVARVWDWKQRTVDSAFVQERVRRAAGQRLGLPGHLPPAGKAPHAVRLVHGETDDLPGVAADLYGDTVVVQLLSVGAERWRECIADSLAGIPGVARVWERSTADVRGLEGLPPRTGMLRGRALEGPLTIEEHGLKFLVDVESGHKTGFYLDQRDNRKRLRELASGCDVLDCFCYTGGFALNAVKGGANAVTAVDSSKEALAAGRRNAELNGLGQPEWIEADVFQHLRTLRDSRRSFDIVVLDPPKFAPTSAHAEKAARAYKDINLLAFKLLKPGGLLMTYSCSGGVSADLFQKIVAGSALDAGVDARIEAWLHAAPDHPVSLAFPEGEYLKGLLCRLAPA